MSLFAVTALLLSALSQPAVEDVRDYPAPPSVNLNAIHLLHCIDNTGEEYTGSAWLIAKNTLATANHVASGGKCFDETARVMVRPYLVDEKHDFALMAGKEPSDEPYIKYTCARPKVGKMYESFGITSYGYEWGHELFRSNTLRATGQIVKDDNAVQDDPYSKGMRLYYGAIAPGMSGGPVIDPETGYAYALNNAGDSKSSLLFDLADTALCTTPR